MCDGACAPQYATLVETLYLSPVIKRLNFMSTDDVLVWISHRASSEACVRSSISKRDTNKQSLQPPPDSTLRPRARADNDFTDQNCEHVRRRNNPVEMNLVPRGSLDPIRFNDSRAFESITKGCGWAESRSTGQQKMAERCFNLA